MKLYTVTAFILATSLRLSADPIPVSVTLSGGVSLGAYQAGYLYYLSEVIKKNRDIFAPKLATGSSAGGINSLLYVLATCTEEPVLPQDSPLWATWMGLSAADFIGPAEDNRALASRQGLVKVADEIKIRWDKGLPTSCDMVVGITAARLRPDRSELASVDLARETEHFILRVQGLGSHQPPRLTNYVNAATASGAAVLDLHANDNNQNFKALRDLLFATSAFPLVFAPQKLNFCLTDPSQPRWLHADYPLACAPNEVQSADFIDGGLFDNKPLALADRTARTGLNHSSGWNAIPALDQNSPSNNANILYLYSDIGSTAYPKSSDVNPTPFLSTAGLILQDVLNSSRDGDSVSLFEQNPALISQIAHSQNFYPRAGDPLLGFFGFFEHDFREFDFYLGMYEAQLFIKNKLASSLFRGQKKVLDFSTFKLPESTPKDAAINTQWQPFVCLKGLFEHGDCYDPSVSRNFKILARTSIERLSAFCQAYGAEKATTSGCSLVPPTVHAHYQKSEDDFGFTLRTLAANQFEFHDLGLSRSRAADAGPKIKTASLWALNRLANAQPSDDKFALQIVGPSVMNLIEPIPSEREYFLLLGPAVELGGSFLFSGAKTYPPTLRYTFTAQVKNLETWLGSEPGRPVPAALLGIESEISALHSQLTRALFGVSAGYQFASTDDLPDGSRDPDHYSGMMIKPSFSLTLFDRLRLQLEFEILPFQKNNGEAISPWATLPSIGLVF